MHEQIPLHPLSSPLFRVYLCGSFQMECRVGTVYEPLSLKAWGGSHDPRRLLKRLLCSPRRQVRRGELLEDLWPEVDPDVSRGYLNDAVYRLRGALSPAKGAKSLLITANNHSSLAVPGQEILWVDADAALAVLAQAEVVEREGADPVSLVQEASRLLERGQFLEEEEGLWAHGRRATIERTRHGCLLWQARLYQKQGTLRRAENLLNTLLEQDAMDEDALSLLMTNLYQQQRTSEAIHLFEATVHLFHKEGLEVSASTKEVILQIRQQMSSKDFKLLPSDVSKDLLSKQEITAYLYDSDAQKDSGRQVKGSAEDIEYEKIASHSSSVLPSSQVSTYMLAKSGILVPVSTMMYAVPSDTIVADCAAWFGYRQAHLLAWIDTLIGQDVPITEFQRSLDQEFKMFDEAKSLYRSDEYLLSRRQALIALAMLPLGQLIRIQQRHWQEDFLFHCATSLTACWHLMQGKEFAVIEEILSAYIPLLATLTQHPSLYRISAAGLASQAYRLKGIVALHQNNLAAREHYCKRAVLYGEIAEEPGLQVAALISLASTFYYTQSPAKAISTYRQALLYREMVPPLQRSRIYAELAVVAAQEGQIQEALAYQNIGREEYPEHPEQDPSFLYAEFSPASMLLEEGLAYLALSSCSPTQGYEKQAWETFERFELLQIQGDVPERIRYEIVNHQAETALALRDREAFCAYLQQGIEGSKLLHSQQRRQELVSVYTKAREVVWPNETKVKELANLFLY